MITLTGMSGTNPRDFLAALGLLRLAATSHHGVRLSFANDGAYAPEVEGVSASELCTLIVDDAASQAGAQPWRLEYEKSEKRGTKNVADLKPPPAIFRTFVEAAISSWLSRQEDGAGYAAAFGTDVAVDGKGNTKPTALHFTAANQQFLDTVEKIRASIDQNWCEQALFAGRAYRTGANLRWDLGADRAYALMANNPVADGTTVNAPLEWLAFRALPLLPVVPQRKRAETTGVRGRGDEMRYRWPLWTVPASLATATSLIRLNWWDARMDRAAVGVIAVCTSEIRRTGQGFGNFGPAEVTV